MSTHQGHQIRRKLNLSRRLRRPVLEPNVFQRFTIGGVPADYPIAAGVTESGDLGSRESKGAD